MVLWGGVAAVVVVAALVIGAMASSGNKSSHSSGVVSPTTYVISDAAATAVSPASSRAIEAQLLSLSDLRAGWSVNNSPDTDRTYPSCLLSAVSLSGVVGATATARFQGGSDGIPLLEEGIADIPGQARQFMSAFDAVLGGCGRVTFQSGGDTFTGDTEALSFPKLGDQSEAYQMNLSTTTNGLSLTLGLDFVAIRKGDEVAVLYHMSLGTSDASQLQQFAQTAAAKLRGSAA
jgi:hypothetical protein